MKRRPHYYDDGRDPARPDHDADPFADEPLTEPEPLSAEDARLLAMEDEAADYAERRDG